MGERLRPCDRELGVVPLVVTAACVHVMLTVSSATHDVDSHQRQRPAPCCSVDTRREASGGHPGRPQLAVPFMKCLCPKPST